jgi:ferredoxin
MGFVGVIFYYWITETPLYQSPIFYNEDLLVISTPTAICKLILSYPFKIYPKSEEDMTHIITSLCLRDGGCVTVCPVECIVGGKPESEWPWFYIDPDTCIDCGACVPECPYAAIFPEDEVPSAYKAKGAEKVAARVGTAGFDLAFDGSNHEGEAVHLDATRALKPGEVVDLTKDIPDNYRFFKDGPGYNAA